MFKVKQFLSIVVILTLFLSCKSQADIDDDQVMSLIKTDRCPEAVQLATKAIEKYPNDARFYYRRGYCNLRTDIYKAREDFANCIRIDAKYYNGYYGLALSYTAEGQYDLAEKNFNKALELITDKENKSSVFGGLAIMYSAKKEHQKAIETQKKALELSNRGDDYFRLGLLYFENNQKKEAESKWLEGVNEKEFKQIEFKHKTYARLAEYYFLEKDYIKAKYYIEKAIELAPNNNEYIKIYNVVKK